MEYLEYYEAFARDYYRRNYGREPTKDEIIRYIADVYAQHMRVDYDIAVKVVAKAYENK